MKKILFLLVLVALVIPFAAFSEDIEAVAGEGNYKIDMKLHNLVQSAYNNKLEMEVCLPVADMFKMYFIAIIEDAATFGTSADPTSTTDPLAQVAWQTWTAANNTLKMYVGIPITDTFHLNILVGGGTTIGQYDTSGHIVRIKGQGDLNIGVGLKLKSAMFGDAISDLKIRQFFDIKLAGKGDNKLIDTTNGLSWAVYSAQDSDDIQYFGFKYSGFIGTGLPGKDLGTVTFGVGLELDYSIEYNAVTKFDITRGNTLALATYDALPAKLSGAGNFKVNFSLNYANFENNVWIKPGFAVDSTSWKYRLVTDKRVDTAPRFVMQVGANWKATFAKYVWLKLDAMWNFTAGVNSVGSDGIAAGVFTIVNAVDPGLTLGINFTGWNVELKWKPKAVWATTLYQPSGLSVDSAGIGETNILNLANWEFGVSCSFPAK
jgi:hypothetical protein